MTGLSTVYGGSGVGNENLWGNTTVVGGDELPPYSAEDDDPVVVSLLDPAPRTPVGFAFGAHTEVKKELLDMNGSDAEGEIGGGVVIPVAEEDAEPAEIRVDDEDTITPAEDNKESGSTEL